MVLLKIIHAHFFSILFQNSKIYFLPFKLIIFMKALAEFLNFSKELVYASIYKV